MKKQQTKLVTDDGKRVRIMGLGLAFLLIGMSAASYSHKETASNGKVSDKGSLVQASSKPTQAKAQESAGKLPLAFEANQGQTDPSVQFVARASGYTAFLASDGVVMRVKGSKEGVLAMKMQNAKPTNRGAGSDEQRGKSNYLLGSDRSQWITNVAHYGKVGYKDTYPGIDVVYSGNQRNLEYDFIVKPGADPKQIRLAYEGATRTTLTADGDLELVTAAGSTIAHKPVVYQTVNGRRQVVEGNYVPTASGEFGFKLGAYDAGKDLVIDPTVTALAYAGGTGDDQGYGIAVNATGVYLTGQTASLNFPLTPGACSKSPTYPSVNATCASLTGVEGATPAYQIVNRGGPGGFDAFVTKIAQDSFTGASYLVYSTYIGGTGDDFGRGVAVDASGNAYVTGWTTSVTSGGANVQFPITIGSYTAGVTQVAFLTAVNPAGNGLVYSTVLGALGVTQSVAIALDSGNNAYIGGLSTSGALTTASTAIQVYGGGTTDGFAAKFSSAGALTFATYLGGSGTDQVNGIALDASGNIYVAGTTASVGGAIPFPVTGSGATMAVSTAAAGSNGFATKIKADLSGLTYSSTFGSGAETATAIVVDAAGNAYVTGGSSSATGLASTTPAPTVVSGTVPGAANSAAYLLSLTANGQNSNFLDYGPVQAGSGASYNGVAIDSQAQVYVVGTTSGTAIGQRYTSTGNGLFAAGAQTLNSSFSIGTTIAATTAGAGIAVNSSDTAFLVGTSGEAGVTINGNFGYPAASANVAATGLKRANIGDSIGAAKVGGNDVIYSAVQFQDFVLSQPAVSVSQVLGGSAPAPVFIGATFLNNNPSCNAGTLTVTPQAPTASTIPALPAGAIGLSNIFTVSSFGSNTYQISLAGTAPTAPGTYVQNETFSSACADNAVTIQLTYNITASIVATPLNTLTLTESFNSGIIAPINTAPGTATIPVTVTSPAGTSVPYTVTLANLSSNFPNGSPCTLVTFTGATTGPATPSGAQFIVNVTPNCFNATTPRGTYTANIVIGGPGIANPATLPFSLTVSGGLTFGGNTFFSFTNSSSSPVSNVLTLSATTGGPFSYAATYTPATPSNGVSPLPAANVTFLSGQTGSIASGAASQIVMQVAPTALTTGTYTGTLTINPAGTSTFTPLGPFLVTAVVGSGGLFVASPSTGILNLTAPTGIASLPTSIVSVGTTSATNVTINGPSNATPGVTVSSGATSWLSVSGADCTINSSSSACSYTVSINTFALAPAAYGGTISFKTNTATPLTTSLTVNLAVSALPSFLLTPGGAINGPNYFFNPSTNMLSFTMPPVSNAGTCVATAGTLSLNLSANGGTINNTTYTVATITPIATSASGLPFIGPSWLTLNSAPGPTINTAGGPLQICVNPSLVGSTGTFLGSVTVSSPNASGPLTIAVSLAINGTPNNIDLSNIGVFRSVIDPHGFPVFGLFALDLDQASYNFNAGTTKYRFFGLPGDQPVAGDWLGTGVVTLGVFRNGVWYFDLNNNGQFDANEGPFLFGLPGDAAIVGDWTGSGSTKVGVFRCPASGVCTWYLSTAIQTAATLVPGANLYSPATTLVYSYGLPGDQPVANNWSGTSKVDQIGVFRCPATGVCSWIVENVGDGVYRTNNPVYSFGLPGDVAVVGDWNDSGQRKRIGVFRFGLWILEINGTNVFAPNDTQASFGLSGDKPVVGKWTMP